MQAKKYLLLFVALFFINMTGAYAQYDPWWQWAKADTVNTATVSNAGSLLAVKYGKALWGRMSAIKRFSNGEPQGNYKLAEYDSNGREMNIVLIQGKVQLFDAQADAAGNWYVLGKFYDSILFSSGLHYERNSPATNVDADHFMVRFNANSMTIGWFKFIGPFTTVSSRSFTMDNNRIYLACDSLNNTVVRSMSFATGDQATLLRQQGQSNTTSIQVDAQGNIYLAGTCALDGIDFNGATEPATVPEPYTYIVKYRSNGTHRWHHWMRDRNCFPRKLTLFQNRFLYYSGTMQDTASIGGIPMTETTGPDFIAARLDTNGAVLWARQMDQRGGYAQMGDPYHAVVTPDTALVMFPQATQYCYWKDSVITDLTGVTAATLVSVSAGNKTRWARPVYADYTINQHIATEGPIVWVTGNIYSNAAHAMFDTLRLKVPARKYTPFLAKTKMIRPIPVDPPAGVGGTLADDVTVYPIPVHTTLKIDGLQGRCAITLSDISGRAVRSLNTEVGTTQAMIHVGDLPRGMYVLDIRGAGDRRMVRKIILQ